MSEVCFKGMGRASAVALGENRGRMGTGGEGGAKRNGKDRMFPLF